ncbi:MAG: replication-associated protein, partial [Staphylococcus equorum]
EESKGINQQQDDEQPTEVQHDDIAEEKKDVNTNEEVLAKDDEPSEEIESETEDRGEQPSKKGFWSRLFGN